MCLRDAASPVHGGNFGHLTLAVGQERPFSVSMRCAARATHFREVYICAKWESEPKGVPSLGLKGSLAHVFWNLPSPQNDVQFLYNTNMKTLS